MGFKPGLYWRLCWKFVSPAFLLVCSVARAPRAGAVSQVGCAGYICFSGEEVLGCRVPVVQTGPSGCSGLLTRRGLPPQWDPQPGARAWGGGGAMCGPPRPSSKDTFLLFFSHSRCLCLLFVIIRFLNSSLVSVSFLFPPPSLCPLPVIRLMHCSPLLSDLSCFSPSIPPHPFPLSLLLLSLLRLPSAPPCPPSLWWW